MRESLSLPGLMIAASYLGFGSLVSGTGLSLWLGLTSTATGWALAAGRVPLSLTLTLVLLNPLYFMLMLVEVRQRSWLIALIMGAALGPPLHALNPEWGLMLTGLIRGTAAWGLARHWPEWPRRRG